MTCRDCAHWHTQTLDDGTRSNYGTFTAKDGEKREKNLCALTGETTWNYNSCDKYQEKLGNQRRLL